MTDTLRADAHNAVRAMITALDPAAHVRTALHATRRDAAQPARVHLLAVGKAADGMADGAFAALGHRLAGGLIVAPSGTGGARPAGVQRRTAAHPAPDAASHAAARAALAMIARIPAGDALLVLLSGGASSLLALPAPGLSIRHLAATGHALLAAAMPIDRVNAVRKHIDRSKGGRLAAAAAHAGHVRVLAISDVVGDRLDVIGSGPFHPDPTTFADAIAALRAADAWDRVPDAVRRLLLAGHAGGHGAPPESPKPGAAAFERVSHEIVCSNPAARAALAAAIAAGGTPVLDLDTPLTGHADAAGVWLADRARALDPGHALVVGGETVVRVTGAGRGGRNQQLALAAALAIDGMPGTVIASIATDGVDGPTDAAGAIVDGFTSARIRAAGIDPADALRRHDAHPALDAAGALLRTGPTGTNVADVQLVLRRRPM